jgi:hypothetical protein
MASNIQLLIAVSAFLSGCVSLPTNQSLETPVAAETCVYNRGEMLALSQDAFDQDMEGGWRALANRAGCIPVAADLIRDYRETKQLTASILYWHEGQLRASLGETEHAIQLFEKSRHPKDDPFGWNLYVDATIAFIRKDKPALLNAREALARLPRPPDFDPRDAQGNAIEVSWPPNLHVVDGLIECFEREYKDAYRVCRK